MVDLSTAAPRLQGNDRMSAIAPVAFLFRVELTATHDVSFIWAVSGTIRQLVCL